MLLSICIPTRNRKAILSASLGSIISQDFFRDTDDVELVISDNSSDDDTWEYLQGLQTQYAKKIRIARNECDIRDRNFEAALQLGRGEYLKLANDSLVWEQGSVELMFKMVEAAIDIQPTLVFSNGTLETEAEITYVRNSDELLRSLSFSCTWIGGFGVWRSKLASLTDFSRRAESSLVQVDALFRLFDEKCGGIIVNKRFATGIYVGRKGDYSLSEVFGRNYLNILRQISGIKSLTLAEEKRRVLEKHILPHYFSGNYDFFRHSLEVGLEEWISEPYYTTSVNAYRADFIRRFPEKWREINPHNETNAVSYFDPTTVSVGNFSYGSLHVHTWGAAGEALSIGNFVSIADDVRFILGGNHPYKGISTFPFKVKFFEQAVEAGTKGKITVGDDVWIGRDVLILSGVSVGQGAVIGAGSVIVKDVPPYAVVVGNPARIVKYRFSPALREKLLTIDFGAIDRSLINEVAADFFYREVTDESVDYLLSRLPRKAQ